MSRIESFIKRLKTAEQYQRQQLAMARGWDFADKLNKLDLTEELIKGAEGSVKPGSAGFGMTGEATKRASRGGPFNQS